MDLYGPQNGRPAMKLTHVILFKPEFIVMECPKHQK